MIAASPTSSRTVAVLGAILVLPTLLFVSASVLKYELGVPFLYDALAGIMFVISSPMVVLGGLVVALAINLWPLVRINIRREAKVVSATVALRLSPANLGVTAAAGLLMGVIFLYLVVENLGHVNDCVMGGPCIWGPGQIPPS